MYTLNDEFLHNLETIEGEAWYQFLAKFKFGWRKLESLKEMLNDPEDDIFSGVPFQEMLRQAIDTRPFSSKALLHYINLRFGPGEEVIRDSVYGLLEVAYQYLFEDAPLESVGTYIDKAQEQIRMKIDNNREYYQKLVEKEVKARLK